MPRILESGIIVDSSFELFLNPIAAIFSIMRSRNSYLRTYTGATASVFIGSRFSP